MSFDTLLHPDRLHYISWVYGLDPVDVKTCSVLGDGLLLEALRVHLPKARCMSLYEELS